MHPPKVSDLCCSAAASCRMIIRSRMQLREARFRVKWIGRCTPRALGERETLLDCELGDDLGPSLPLHEALRHLDGGSQAGRVLIILEEARNA